MNAGISTWRAWEAFEKRARPLREKHEKVSHDSDLTDAARVKKTHELEQEFSQLHRPLVARLRRNLAGLEEAAIAALPQAIEAGFAARKPKDAVEMRELAKGATMANLKGFIEDAASRGSLARAHGLRRAIVENDGLEDAEKGELLKNLDSISEGQREEANSALVSFKVAFAGLEGSSVFSPSLVLRDPKKALDTFRLAGLIPNGPNGETVQLTGAEIQRLTELSGVPLHPPGVDQ